ncbi:hypothetical protein C8A03DRAFT_30555 [Achaetomium macrosporum]|uniref:Pentatricopeptide repeat-containing protein n=1 Tax=Achaetomium macrosporum TaxID=79813 RepID=A0AAN7HI08_9PEZI|nr:hypothetical protein C8A03DRAFT_30555 [Achaetomium macrosporum]
MRQRIRVVHWRPGEPVEETLKKVPREVEEAFQAWDRKFRVLWYRMKSGQTGKTDNFKGKGMRDVKALLQRDSIWSMTAAWFTKDLEWRKRNWADMMLSAMNFYPERTPELLLATIEPRVTPSEFVVDIMCFLFEQSSQLPARERGKQQAAIPHVLLELLDRFPSKYFTFPQWLLGRVFSISQPPLVKKLYRALYTRAHPLDWNTKFKAASCLARDVKGKELALKILERVMENGLRMEFLRGQRTPTFLGIDRVSKAEGERVYQWVNVNDPNFRLRFAELATAIVSMPEGWRQGGDGSPFTLQSLNDMYKRLIGLGIPLNLKTQTAMLQAICSTGELEAAWNLYHDMLEQGIKPDERVYLILLNAAKHAGSIESTIRVILEAPAEVLQSHYIWNEFLSTVIQVAIKECNERGIRPPRTIPAFDFMLRIYEKFFKLEPLNKLLPSHLLIHPDNTTHWEWKAKLAVVIDKLPAREPNELVDPRADTLGIMFHGYVKALSNASLLVSFYAHFRTLLKNGDPHVLELLRHTTLPYDTIIKAVTEHPGLLRVAADILNDMLRDAGASSAITGARDRSGEISKQQTEQEISTSPSSSTPSQPSSAEAPFVHPLPSVHTWNTVLRGFFMERRVRQGWRIFELMRQHGAEPNKVTWNTLIAGYTASGENELAVQTLIKFEKLGLKADWYTQRQMSILSKHEPTREMMERAHNERTAIRLTRKEIRRVRKRLVKLEARKEEILRKLNKLGPATAAAQAKTKAETETGAREELSPTADFFQMYDELIFQAEQL